MQEIAIAEFAQHLAEQEKLRADRAEQICQQEKLRADHLASYLLSLGINPEEIG